jgi:hypothetical protein
VDQISEVIVFPEIVEAVELIVDFIKRIIDKTLLKDCDNFFKLVQYSLAFVGYPTISR